MTDGGNKSKRRLIALIAILIVVAAAIALIVVLISGDPDPALPDAGATLSADAGAVVADAEIAHDSSDLAADQAQRRGTRIIGAKELRKMQRKHRGLIKFCYQRAARRAPSSVARKARVSVLLGDRGRTKSVRVEAGGDSVLQGCLRRMIRGWRFSSSLKAQMVRFPVVFAR